MADAVVSIVLERLTDSIIQQFKFLSGVGDQVELAQTELQFMQGYLKDADARQGGNEAIRTWVTSIREAAYDLQDVIETFVLKVSFNRERSAAKWFCRIFVRGVHLHKIGSEIETITNRISKLKLSLPSYNLQEIRETSTECDTSFRRQQERRLAYPHVVEPHVIGLAARTEELVVHLIKEKRNRVVSIWGMGGLGKTTLAKQVYNHDEVKRHFDCFAWVSVSQRCQGREVLEEILTKLVSPTNEQSQEIAKLKKDQIAERLCVMQRERKCLVVLDDIWTRDAWNSLQAGFPVNEETGSQILLTTRNKDVAFCADTKSFIYQPQSLDDEESWELFEKIAMFGTEEASPEIFEKKKELGKKMLQDCVGLPLAITVLAGLLARKETVDEWDMVHKNFYAYLRRGTDLGPEYNGEEYEGVSWILALSYDNLPYRLKLCFLYLAHFPEDHEIPVNSLSKLWMAEGFVNSESEEIMEDVSYRCLSELIGRCMVQVGRYGSSMKIKTCRLHDLMRDLCLSKAKEANFLRVINYSPAIVGTEKPSGRDRRLSIYLDKQVDAYAPKRGNRDGHLRSLLYFAPDHFYIFSDKGRKLLPSLLNDFRLLRVLKLEGMKRGWKVECALPGKIGKLVHLRFLSFKDSQITELPSSITNLVCLQTLDLRVCDLMKIPSPDVFSKMEKLRHIYLPYIQNEKLSFDTHAGSLQTVVNARIAALDLQDFSKLTNLRKLAVKLYDGKNLKKGTIIWLNNLQSLSLEFGSLGVPWNVVLSCPNIYKLRLLGLITEISDDLMSLQNLTKLALVGIHHLYGDNIKILEKLPSLRMLFFEDYPAPDKTFPSSLICSAGGFPRLELLSFCGFGELKEWTVKKGAMPSLCRLHIQQCLKLAAIPSGLQYVTTLKELIIDRMYPNFCSRLRKGGEDFHKIEHVRSVIVTNTLAYRLDDQVIVLWESKSKTN